MKLFESVEQYEKEAKQNDRIVLGGKGLMDGIKSLENKRDTFKVVKQKKDNTIVLRRYNSKTNLVIGANAYDQEVGLLSKKEFNELEK